MAFRRLRVSDLQALARWRAAPHVMPWWGPQPAPGDLEAEYIPAIRGDRPVDPYMIVVDDRSVGYVETYRIADWPNFWPRGQRYEDEPGAAGMDLLIGEPELTGRGLGTEVIREFTRRVVFAPPDVTACYADPDAENVASVRAFKKAGFEDIGDLRLDHEGFLRRLLRLANPEATPGP